LEGSRFDAKPREEHAPGGGGGGRRERC